MRRRGAPAAALLLFLLTTAACGGPPPEAGPSPSRTSAQGPQATFVSCGDDTAARRAHTQGNSTPPICSDDSSWNFIVPADEDPALRRRSEVFVSQGEDARIYHSGEYVHYSAVITGSLGEAADTTTDWHVLWQVLGRTDGEWKGPSMALLVADGRLALTGGNGHPQHEADRSYQWNRLITPYRDGTPYRVTIDAYLDAQDGWVTVQLDGETVLDRYRPRTAQGRQVGTIYPGQSELTERYGLYRGSDESPPTYAQMVEQDVVRDE